ncbi:MAG: hypothetical protein J6Q69_02010 [Clostridia bacterium]|nr:hypothetical protein [Clostridia bacterium]
MLGNFVIFGDSYSTYEGYVPDGYAPYYATRQLEGAHPVGAMDLEDTWWRRILRKTGATLVRNDSWSGSTISYTGYQGDCSETSSFIKRYRNLKAEGFFEKNKIDTVIVLGGTNDSWVPSPLGEIKFSNWEESDLFSVRPAITYFMSNLKDSLPNARIIFVANCDIKEEIIECLKISAEHYGVEFIALHDITKEDGHPTSVGMEELCNQIIAHL